jgi:ABC-2 type transport system permease protein
VREVWVLAGKELRGFLRMPLGYVLLAVYALVSGMVLITLLYLFHEQILRAAQQARMATASRAVVDIQVSVVTPYLLNATGLMLFIVPFLTMRSFAEEKRSRSLEVLVSFPLSAWQIVLGKYLGVLAFSVLMLVISAAHMLILGLVSTPELGPLLGGLLGLLLCSAALVSMGLFISSLTSGQIEAAVLTLGLFLGLVMAGEVARPGGSGIQAILASLSPLFQYQDFGRGVLPIHGIFYYLAVTVLCVALTLRGMDLLKWRG